MTGVNELRNVAVVSAAAEAIRVSVLGGRTQLDVALPADVPVAAFLPELARLIDSRDSRRDDDVPQRDERRTFWVLSRVDDASVLTPHKTLREAGINNGELLRISPQRALTPPTLYDDVVDAAARLNRASYAAWDATAAGVMAFAGLWLCAATWVYFLLTDALSAHRVVVEVGAALTTVTLVGGAALVHRTLGRADIATAAGAPAIAISAALGWVLAERFGDFGLAAACAVLLVLAAAYYRVVGTGHWAYIGAAVVFSLGGLVLLGRALGERVDVLAVVAAITAALGCLAVPTLTTKLGRFPAPTEESRNHQRDNPFTRADKSDSGVAMPSAEEVWARVHSAMLTRVGLLSGLSVVVVVGGAVLLNTRNGWPALSFALVCAAVLALCSRRVRAVPERAVLAVPATALLLIACALAHDGSYPMRLGAVGALLTLAVVAMLAGLLVARGGLPSCVATASAYLEYAAAAALIPVGLWALGVLDRLGF